MLSRAVCAAILAALVVAPGWAVKLPSGTQLTVRLQNDVAPDSQRPERFSALLSYPVFVDGRELLPAGSRVEGEVRGDKHHVVLSPRSLTVPGGRPIEFNAAVSGIDRKRLHAEETEGTVERSGSKADAARQAAQVGMTGAAVGAMSTGSAKGMGIGAAAGIAAVLIGRKVAGRNHTTVIPAGTQLTLSLSRELELPDPFEPVAASAPIRNSIPDSDPDDRRPILRRPD